MEFVNYDLAKKLKEKKFNEPCFGYYHLDKGDDSFEMCGNGDYDFFNNINYWRIGAPRIAQVLRWLRNKGIHIQIVVCEEGWYFEVWDFGYYSATFRHQSSDYASYEEAAIGGIEYVLDNLI